MAVEDAAVLWCSNVLGLGCFVCEVETTEVWKWELENVFICVGVRFVCEFEFSKSIRCKGNVVFFGKLQEGFTFSYSRLTLEKWCSTRQYLFVIDLGVKNIFDTKLLGLGTCSSLAGCLFCCVALRVSILLWIAMCT